MPTETDRTTTELIALCRRGQTDAWQALVDRYARLVHAVALRHGLRGGEVEDIAQEVFLALARSLPEIEDPERLPGWLSTTTRRASWRAVQARRRETELSESDEEGSTTDAVALASTRIPSLGEMLDTWQRQEALAAAFSRLDARCRELLTLLFLEPAEPSYDDIASRMDIPKGSIGPTRTRCLQKIRGILESLGHTRRDVL